MWVAPDRHGLEPSYDQADVSAELARGELVAVASGVPGVAAAIRVNNSGATLYAAQLPTARAVDVPGARYTHLFVVTGTVAVDGAELDSPEPERTELFTGDALRVTGSSLHLRAITDAEVLVWSMEKGLGE